LCERSSCKWGEREKGDGRKGNEKSGALSFILSPLRTYYMVFIIFNLVHFVAYLIVNFLVNFLPKSIGCDFNLKKDFRMAGKV